MNRIILINALFFSFIFLQAQDYSKCETLKEFIPPNVVGTEFPNIWDLKKGDTITLNQNWLKTIKIGGDNYLLSDAGFGYKPNRKNTIITYKLINPRKPTFKEKAVVNEWNITRGYSKFLIDKTEMLIVDSGKVFTLSPETFFYTDWCYISRQKANEQINQFGWINNPNLEDNGITYIPSKMQMSTEKLDGVILKDGYALCNPEKHINQKLVIAWIGIKSNNYCTVLFKNEFGEYFYHTFRYDRFYNMGYPLAQTNENLRLQQNREIFRKNISNEIKNIGFTYENRAINSLKVTDVYFNNKEIYILSNRFNKDSKSLGIDTIRYSSTLKLYECNCYWEVRDAYNKKLKADRDKYLKDNFTSKEIQAISQSKIFIGMSEKALVESLGYPWDGINETVTPSFSYKQYVYGAGRYVYVKNGFIESWQKFDF